jgi:hypothetical protein
VGDLGHLQHFVVGETLTHATYAITSGQARPPLSLLCVGRPYLLFRNVSIL